MDALVNALLARTGAQAGQQARGRWGIVESVQPAKQLVRVRLQPEGVLTSWLPVLQQAAAGGWGVLTVPTEGMQAFVMPDLGDASHGVVVGFAHSTAARTPEVPADPGLDGTPRTDAAALLPGETVLTHPSGTVIRLCGDGSIYSRGVWRHDGNLSVNGTVSAEVDVVAKRDVLDHARADGSLAALREAYNEHRHPGVQSGPASTSTTDRTVT